MEQPHQELSQQPEQQQQRRAELRRSLLALRLPAWVVLRFKDDDLDTILLAGFKDLASFQTGATPLAVYRKLRQAGLLPAHACTIEGALERMAKQQQQQGLREGGVAGHGGQSSGGVGPPAGLPPAAATPSQDTGPSHARDQQPRCGGFYASKGWWSAWLSSAPLPWSTQPPQSQPLPPGSATSPSDEAVAAHAPATAPTAEQRAVYYAAHSMPIAATPTPPASQHLSSCRRRHVHRPALGQE